MRALEQLVKTYKQESIEAKEKLKEVDTQSVESRLSAQMYHQEIKRQRNEKKEETEDDALLCLETKLETTELLLKDTQKSLAEMNAQNSKLKQQLGEMKLQNRDIDSKI